MIIEYIIKTSPDPENPNEQPVGSVIYDDRIFGYDKIFLLTNNQSYTVADFVKVAASNTLTMSSVSFDNGQIIVLSGEKSI